MRLVIASIFTLTLLFGFLLAVILMVLFFVGYLPFIWVIALTLIVNFLLWLISPTIADFIYKFFYKSRWLTIEELRTMSKSAADFIEKTCDKYGMKVPKLGFIEDDNPNAFTYGSGRWNARIFITRGIFTYLDDEEVKAIYGHELGHIVHRDFIVMTIASVILQLLYEFYVFARYSSRVRGSNKKGNYLIIVGIISYIFYWIGSYILLYLSRVREYYADEFSAIETGNPNLLVSGLLKVSYGIIAKAESKESLRLMKSTSNATFVPIRPEESVGFYI